MDKFATGITYPPSSLPANAPGARQGRFVSPCPAPVGYRRELIEITAEEAAEIAEICLQIAQHCMSVVQRGTKTLRFGIDEIQAGQPYTNGERLGHEIGNLELMVQRAVDAGITSVVDIETGALMKERQLAKFMQHAPDADAGAPAKNPVMSFDDWLKAIDDFASRLSTYFIAMIPAGNYPDHWRRYYLCGMSPEGAFAKWRDESAEADSRQPEG